MKSINGYVVAVGEPFDAISFYGPFDTPDDAVEYADAQRSHASAWAVPIYSDLARIPDPVPEDTAYECLYAVALGTPFGGYALYGFFEDYEACEEWIARSHSEYSGPWMLRIEPLL